MLLKSWFALSLENDSTDGNTTLFFQYHSVESGCSRNVRKAKDSDVLIEHEGPVP